MRKMELAGGPPVQKGMARGAVWAGVTTALMAIGLLVVYEMTQITHLKEELRAVAGELDACIQETAPLPVASEQKPGVKPVNGSLLPQAVLQSPLPPASLAPPPKRGANPCSAGLTM